MAARQMADLMAHNRCDLIVIVHDVEQSGLKGDLAIGQHLSIAGIAFKNGKFPVVLCLTGCAHNATTDAFDLIDISGICAPTFPALCLYPGRFAGLLDLGVGNQGRAQTITGFTTGEREWYDGAGG
jgi:hypothetical protein